MSYIGVQPTAGQYRKLDNISSGFNGSTTSFTTSVSGTNVTAGTAQQLLVSLGGVIQQPDTDYTVSTNTITFTTAPTSGLSFFAVLMGDALNTVSTSDGAITTAKLAGNLSVGLADGTVSAPSLYFTADTNTGLYRIGANQLGLTTDGTVALTVDASQRVGIGTTSPSQLLSIAGSSANILLAGTSNSYITYNINASNVGYVGDANWMFGGSSSDFGVRATSNLVFGIGATERARIDSSGRLLVGTSTARANFFNSTESSKLQVEGTVTSDSSISVVRNSNNSGYPFIAFGKTRGTTVGANTVVQSGDPVGGLEFMGSDGTEFVTAGSIRCEVDSTPGANDMPGRIVLSTTADGASSPTERMRITSDGYFKASNNSTYSTASPDYHQFNQSAASQWALGVFNRHASQPFGVTIQYLNATPNGTTNSFLLCGDATADRVQIRSNGGIANYSANNVNLSDINTKKDIVPVADTWDCIKEWEIVNYRYKDQPDDTDLNMGVIAQQVAESCPEVITVFEEAKDDQPEKLGVKEQQMYWMAIKALQEAQVRIEALEAEVAALKAQ